MDPFVKSISIVCTFDNNYSQHCGVLLASLFENNKNICFDIYIVSDFIDDVKSEDFIYINKGIIVNMKNTKYVEGHDLIMKNMERLVV